MLIISPDLFSSKTYSRIVSLVPSQTELLYDLGLGKEVLAITKFCVHPESWYATKKKIGGTKNVNISLIKEINPDLIIANKEENVKEQVEELGKNFDVFVSDVDNFIVSLEMIATVGRLTGKGDAAFKLVNNIEEKFKGLAETITAKPKIKTAYLIWKKPYMTVGGDTFINDMMRHCGLQNIYADRVRYPEINLEELTTENCGLIILSSEPYPFKEKHIREIQSIVPGVKVVLADGEMFSWYGSRLSKAADYFEIFSENI
jgi:ABC-type Fe3+-hydroxamate transport system substrate-binding protein